MSAEKKLKEFPDMNGLDLAILAILLISAFISVSRGFVKEAMAFVIWILNRISDRGPGSGPWVLVPLGFGPHFGP